MTIANIPLRVVVASVAAGLITVIGYIVVIVLVPILVMEAVWGRIEGGALLVLVLAFFGLPAAAVAWTVLFDIIYERWSPQPAIRSALSSHAPNVSLKRN